MRRQRMDLKPDLFTPRRPSAPADSMKLLSLIFTIGFQDPTLHYLEWSWPGEKTFQLFSTSRLLLPRQPSKDPGLLRC
jgi:hypothetical protein